MSCQQPFMQWDMATLVQGADRRRERFATVFALVDAWPRALTLQFGRVADNAAMRADRPIRPALRLEMPPGGFFIVKNLVCQIDGHGAPSLPHFLPEGGPVRQVHNCPTFDTSGEFGAVR